MKLSNKILIGLISFILLYLIAAFTEIRFRGNLNHVDDSNAILESADLSEIKYVIINDIGKSIDIIGGSQYKIELKSLSGNMLENLQYRVYSDTLELLDLVLEDPRALNINIYVPNSALLGIIIHDTNVNIKNIDQYQLSVNQKGGYVWIDEETRLTKLSSEISEDGSLNFAGHKLDTLNVRLNNARVVVESAATTLMGEVENGSYLWMNQVDDIDLKKDSQSRLHLN